MKLEVIETGVIIDDVKQPIGTVLDVEGKEIPPSLVGKVRGEGKAFVVNPAPAPTQDAPLKGPFTVGEGVSGWYPVLDADGKAVKKLRKDDSEAFAGLSDDDKLAFLAD